MRLTLYLGSVSAINLIVNFLFQLYLLIRIGPGVTTDAFFAGSTLPIFVLSVISGSLTNVLVPLLVGENAEETRRNTWGMFLLVGLLFSVLAVALQLTANLWVPLLFPGFSGEGKQLTIGLTRIQLIGMPLTALSGVVLAKEHARNRFVWPDTTLPLGSLVAFGMLVWLLPRYGIASAAWAQVIRTLLPTLILLPALGTYRKLQFSKRFLREAWEKIRPLLLGTSYSKAGVLVDRFFSSLAPAGALSLLSLGQQIYTAVGIVLSNAIVAPAMPQLASQAKNRQWGAFRGVYQKRLRVVLILTVGGIAVLIILIRPVLLMLPNFGRFSAEETNLLMRLLLGLGGFLIAGAAGQVLAAALYAQGNTRAPAIIGATGFTLSIAFKITGFWTLGILGIAIGASLHQAFNSIALHRALTRIQRKTAARNL